jgi:hypothetical protein
MGAVRGAVNGGITILPQTGAVRARDLYHLAAEFAIEHGDDAPVYARRAICSFRAEGELSRAHFWCLLAVLVDDIMIRHIDPDAQITYH